MEFKKSGWAVCLLWVLVSLFACSGGDEGDGPIGTGVNLEGTVAVGAAIPGAIVTLKDNNGIRRSAITNSKGEYVIEDVSDLTPPYLLQVVDNKSKLLFAIAPSSGISNIHPFTDFTVRNWFSTRGRDIEQEFDDQNQIIDPPDEKTVAAIKIEIENMIAIVMVDFGIPTDFDFDHTRFDVELDGFDDVLDHTKVSIQNNRITIKFVDPKTEIEGLVINEYDLSTDITIVDNIAPSDPTNLAVIPASDTQLVVFWTASEDTEKAVAGYNIYREEVMIATSPYPVYSDAGLTASTRYCYMVEAFDSTNNTSNKIPVTPGQCATTLDAPDVIPPSPPANLMAVTIDDTTVELQWTPSQDVDVLGYQVFRKLAGTQIKIATVITSAYNDADLPLASKVCYTVKAFDAALNLSNPSDEVCPLIGNTVYTLSVANHSFEDFVLADGFYTRPLGSANPGIKVLDPIPSWIISGQAGTWNNNLAQLPNGTTDGINTAWLHNSISQILPDVLDINTTYELSIDVGFTVGGSSPGYRIRLIAGTSVLAEDNNFLNLPMGDLVTSTIQYTIVNSDPLLGQQLSIVLESFGIETIFDNVRLRAAPVLVTEP